MLHVHEQTAPEYNSLERKLVLKILLVILKIWQFSLTSKTCNSTDRQLKSHIAISIYSFNIYKQQTLMNTYT